MRIELDPALVGDRDELSSEEFRRLVDGCTLSAALPVAAQDAPTAAKGHQTRETDFRDRVVALARSQGWLTYFTQRSDKSPAGYQDLTLLRGDRLIVAELKLATGTLTVAQWTWLDAWRRFGHAEVYVWVPESWREIEEALA